MIEQLSETEIIWSPDYAAEGNNGKPKAEPTHLVVFHQGEHGFASFCAGMGLIGDEEPIARIFSKLHMVHAFNHVPDPIFPEWRLYERTNDEGDRYFILRLIHFYPSVASLEPEDNSHVWLYSYPPIRDVILSLNECGVNQLTYMTSNTMSLFATAEHGLIPKGEVAVFDYMDPTEEPLTTGGMTITQDIILPPPAWIFPYIFKRFCTNDDLGVWVLIGDANEEFIDMDTSQTLTEYSKSVLGLSSNEDRKEEVIDTLFGLREANVLQENTLDVFMSGFENKNGDGGMFG